MEKNSFTCERCRKWVSLEHDQECPNVAYWTARENGKSHWEVSDLYDKGCTCGLYDRWDDETADLPKKLWRELFSVPETGRKKAMNLPHDFPWNICRKCGDELTPAVTRFADIWLVNIYNQRLKRAIHERCKV